MRATGYGSGWHGETLRHSRARRLGVAGGMYRVGQMIEYRPTLKKPNLFLKGYISKKYKNKKYDIILTDLMNSRIRKVPEKKIYYET